jgi:uncharacterized protein
MSASHLPLLSLLETRVVGVLVEKQHTVPDTYPLTLNALVAGCNQKTSRSPVLEATEAEVQSALDHLKAFSLVIESSGGRVMRYSHNAGKALQLPPQSVALLATLFNRGPQTAGELRINSERLHHFGDISAVEAFLGELSERPGGAFVRELPRRPGEREARWVHLLSGEPEIDAMAARQAASGGADAVSIGEITAIKAHVLRLEEQVGELRTTVEALRRDLGA